MPMPSVTTAVQASTHANRCRLKRHPHITPAIKCPYANSPPDREVSVQPDTCDSPPDCQLSGFSCAPDRHEPHLFNLEHASNQLHRPTLGIVIDGDVALRGGD